MPCWCAGVLAERGPSSSIGYHPPASTAQQLRVFSQVLLPPKRDKCLLSLRKTQLVHKTKGTESNTQIARVHHHHTDNTHTCIIGKLNNMGATKSLEARSTHSPLLMGHKVNSTLEFTQIKIMQIKLSFAM